jgi:hypothetical protein
MHLIYSLKIFLLILFFLFNTTLMAVVTEFKPKIHPSLLRFSSKKGQYTYYQKNSGELFVSFGGNNYLLLTPDYPHQRFFVAGGISGVAISSESSLEHAEPKLYYLKHGQTKPSLLGSGHNLTLHLNDQFASFYEKKNNVIHLVFLPFKENHVLIQLNNQFTGSMYPATYMPNEQQLIYSDYHQGLFLRWNLYDRIQKSFKTFYESNFPFVRGEICPIGSTVLFGEFPFLQIESLKERSKTRIFQLNLNEINQSDPFKKATLIYENELGDIGHMKCFNNDLYFIHQIKNKTGGLSSEYHQEVIHLWDVPQIKNNKPKITLPFRIETNFEHVQNLIVMDDMLLTMNLSTLYMIGNN